MPRNKMENQRIRDSQRASILEAAKGVFARKGWASTVADIAAASKVSQGLIYHYFSNKEAIFSELMAKAIQSDSLSFETVLKSEGTPTQRLETLITRIIKYRHESIKTIGITVKLAMDVPSTGNNHEIMRRILQNLPSEDSEVKDLQELMKKRFQSLRDVITQLIVEGQNSGEFALDNPSKLALMIITCIESLTRFALDQLEYFEKYYPYTEIIMRMLKP